MTRPDGSIIVGGAWRVIRPGPREDWVNVTDDSGLIPAATDYYTGFMDRTFKSWEGTKSDVDYLWTGIMGVCSPPLSTNDDFVAMLTVRSLVLIKFHILVVSTKSQACTYVQGLMGTVCRRCCFVPKVLSRWYWRDVVLRKQAYRLYSKRLQRDKLLRRQSSRGDASEWLRYI